MRDKKNINSFEESKNILRQFNISSIIDDIRFTYEEITNKDYSWRLRIFGKKNIRLIKEISKLGEVLTGSRILSKTLIDNKRILDRNTKNSDWDFLITESILYEITSNHDFSEYSRTLTKTILQGSYESDTQKIHLIVVKDLPSYTEVGNFKYCCPITNLYKKIEFKERGIDSNKHENDIQKFFWKFNYLTQPN